jgi:hypothetical protein
MTSGPDPLAHLWRSLYPRLRQTRRAVARARTPMALGGYLLRAVSDDLLIASPVPTRREDQGIVGDASAVTP